jgi:hypothetical protein
MRKDAQLFETLAPIQLAVDQLQKQIDDTVMQVGGEAYAAARTIYAVSKTPFAEASRNEAGSMAEFCVPTSKAFLTNA